MRKEEFDAFKGELKQLCSTLGKRYDDALAQAYWRSLRDVELDEVQKHVERVLLNANAETKFPKPAQLRSTPPPAGKGSRPQDHESQRIERKCAENWEELRRKDLEEWFRRMEDKPAARLVQQYGSANVFFDLDEWCWRKVPVSRGTNT
jgi:ribosomal protein L12E/L44/L45/RPP1/RPP2